MPEKKTVGFYTSCIAAVFGIAAIILYFSNISNTYFADAVNWIIVWCTVIAILLTGMYPFLLQAFRMKKVVMLLFGVMPVVATFCFFAAIMLFLGTRVYSMAIIFGSSLEADNVLAHNAMNQAIVTLIIYFAAGVFTIITSFSKVRSEC